MAQLTITALDDAGTPLEGASVLVYLSDLNGSALREFTSDGLLVHADVRTTDVNGEVVLDLPPNADVQRPNTYYTVKVGNRAPVLIAKSSGSQTLFEALVTSPSALGSAAALDTAVVHKAQTETITGNKTFTGNVVLPSTTTVPDDTWTIADVSGLQEELDAGFYLEPISGDYYYVNSPGAGATSNGLGNGTVRVTPRIVRRAFTISRIGMEFTAAGDASSVFRVGVWSDTGQGKPGALLRDCGTISTGTGNAGDVATGGTPNTYEIVLGSPLTLTPGLYWFGGAVQGVSSVQPTIRIINAASFIEYISQTNVKPAASFNSTGFNCTGQTGAFGAFGALNITSAVPRLFFKVA